MCGISVILKRDGSRVERDDLVRMVSTLHHRGPDEAGIVLLNQDQVGLGHARLSIVDLSTGLQPMASAAGRPSSSGLADLWITFNGEIYDYQALRSSLADWGYPFRTHSDTEVILAAYERWGSDCLHHINGEFAFAIWDTHAQMLFCARDPAGVKPLYFYESSEEVLIASEAKAILTLQRVPKKISQDYLCGPFMGVYPREVCAFEGIRSLEPGGVLEVILGRVTTRVWWRSQYSSVETLGRQDAQAIFREKLSEAVARRCVADVPVHVYLSGGADSTAICGLMREHQPGLTAFNIGFDDPHMDESPIAARIARHYGVRFESIRFTNEDLVDDLEKAVFHTELPIANPNTMAKLALSRFVHLKGYKVCLTGEGADELLGGYPYFKLEALWRMWARGGEEARQADQLWKRFKKMEYRSKGLGWYPGLNWRRGPHLFGYACFNEMRVRKTRGAHRLLLNADSFDLNDSNDPVTCFERAFDRDWMKTLDPFHASREIAFNQLSGYLIPNLGDRVEMANSLECRTPFLDRELLEFVNTIPPDFMMEIGTLREKALLHQSLQGIFPPFMSEIHKHPFLAPSWSKFSSTSKGKALFDYWLSPGALRDAGILNGKRVRALRRIWKLTPEESLLRKQLDIIMGSVLSLQVLHDQFIRRKIPSNPRYPYVDLSYG
jgi:asparagine synthase (glutamine-hydrolysing)